MQLKGQQTLEELDKKEYYLAEVCEDVKQLEQKLRRVYQSSCGVEF